MLGGVLLAIATGLFYIVRRRWPLWRLADACIPSFALGLFITRIGCFLNGCCFGRGTSCSLGVSFPAGSLPYSVFGAMHVHPTQLYGSLKGLFILLLLLWAGRRRHFPGFLFCLFLALYGITRFGLEEFRYFDHATNSILGYSVFAQRPGVTDNQIISLCMLVAAVVLGVVLHRRDANSAGSRGSGRG